MAEAWEVIAGELPPGWEFDDDDEPSAFHADTGARTLCYETEHGAARAAWSIYGGRRAYAESIAPRLVREAAAKKYDGLTGVVLHQKQWAYGDTQLWATDGTEMFVKFDVYGPDICTAALAAIRALEEAT